MMKWMKQQRGIVLLSTGVGTVFVGYFAWGLLTVFHKRGSFGMAGFLFSLLTMLLYALFCHFTVMFERKEIGRQILAISVWGFLICLLLLLRGGNALLLQGEYQKFIMNIFWLTDFAGCCLYLGSRMLRITDKRLFCASCFTDHISKAWSKHKYIYILLAATFLLLLEPDALQFKWDGFLYYLACQDLSLDSISSLALYGHIAQTYGMFNGLGTMIVGDTATAMVGINVILFLCSVCAFYGMVKCALPGKKDSVYALVTAIYAWSPFTLGMVFYHNLDFYCQCFFVIMLYYLYRRQWIYFFVASMLFCFTKEPAILIYGAICVSIVIMDFIDLTGFSFGTRIGRLLRIKRYYFMILPGILWLVTYQILGPWSGGVGGFDLDTAYVLEKLKALYVFQFNWLFTILCVCGAVFCAVRKRKEIWRYLFPVLCGQMAFTVFSCVFKTVNHPRYNGAGQPALYCMAILLTSCFLEHLYGRILAGVLAALMAVSSFCTIDPVTLWRFSTFNVGDAVMVTTDKQPLGDGMIYNRQMLWLEHALEMALEDSLKESDVVIVPSLDNNTYYFDGMAQTAAIDENKCWLEQEYWNTYEHRRVTTPGDGVQSFTVYQLPEEVDWDRLGEEFSGRYNYCYLPCAGERRAEEIRERFHILEEEEYAYRGWKVERICFE